MCGICGIVNFDGAPVSSALLEKMAAAIAHRGPDGEGYYTDGAVGLGHKRLSIIDLSEAGRQPMVGGGGRLVISYNGEVYNFRELRAELESLGHKFRGHSDTEVVLKAYEQWGEKAVGRFNGMFAFAIWDRRNRELFIARDRYGKKPFYYHLSDGMFVFASEQKAIVEHPGIEKELDLEALVEYFTFQNIFTDRTFLKNIRSFPAGHWARLKVGQASSLSEKRTDGIRPVCFWDFDFNEPERPMKENEYLEELDRLFTQAVNRQLVSDVEVGAYLSGGIDSGSVTAVAATHLPYLKTFTCGFDLHSASGMELGFDEREKAEYMSYLFKTEHYEMVLKAGDMERVMSDVAWHVEEPRVGQSYPNYYAALLASKFVKVVLSGGGGDEIFGGYPWRYYRAVTSDDFEGYIDKYYSFWQRLLQREELEEVFSPVWDKVSHVCTRDIFQNVFKKHEHKLNRPEDYINHSLYFEAKTFLHGLLVVEDKLSMAHGLETRLPFLDNDLVDFAMKVPARLKLGNLGEVARINENEPGGKIEKYFKKTRDGKLILRKTLGRYVPEKVANAFKQGFSAPDASWFKGESIDYVRRVLYDPKAMIYNVLDMKSVKLLLDEHLEGRKNKRLLIWSLLNFESWCENFL